MKAYAILDGGGVKGAALAGCLAAAEEQGVVFQGYGGTSAGSLVAVLAAVGYSGNELRDIVVNDLDMAALLDDRLSSLLQFQDRLARVQTGLSSRNPLRRLWAMACVAPK